MVKDDSIYIGHILDALDRIAEYSQDLTHEKFMTHPIYQDAIIRKLEITGEAVRHLSGIFTDKHPQIPLGMILWA